jgi:hypothetical protein
VIGRRIMKISNPAVARSDIVAAGIYFLQLYDEHLAGAALPDVFRLTRACFRGLGFGDTEVGAAQMIAERIHPDVDDLRESQQRLTDYLLTQVKPTPRKRKKRGQTP